MDQDAIELWLLLSSRHVAVYGYGLYVSLINNVGVQS